MLRFVAVPSVVNCKLGIKTRVCVLNFTFTLSYFTTGLGIYYVIVLMVSTVLQMGEYMYSVHLTAQVKTNQTFSLKPLLHNAQWKLRAWQKYCNVSSQILKNTYKYFDKTLTQVVDTVIPVGELQYPSTAPRITNVFSWKIKTHLFSVKNIAKDFRRLSQTQNFSNSCKKSHFLEYIFMHYTLPTTNKQIQ